MQVFFIGYTVFKMDNCKIIISCFFSGNNFRWEYTLTNLMRQLSDLAVI